MPRRYGHDFRIGMFKSSGEKYRAGMRLLVIILTGLLLFLQIRLWTGEGSLADVWQINQDVSAQRSENEHLKARNLALEAEVNDLKKGSAAIEERARSELGMIKEGETFFQVIAPPDARNSNHQTVSYYQ